jgi:hypothetical protein
MARSATPADAEYAIANIAAHGYSRRKCAIQSGCDYPSLCALLNTAQYSARAQEAGRQGAEAHLDAAHEALTSINDDAQRGEVARQIALEQHHRKMASFLDRARYGERTEVAVTTVSLSGVLSDIQQRRQMIDVDHDALLIDSDDDTADAPSYTQSDPASEISPASADGG